MKHHIWFIKLLDRYFGKFLLNLLPKSSKNRTIAKCKKVLIIRPGGMGDAALLLPSLKAVKNKYTDIKIDILCEARNEGVFKSIDFIDDIFLYHKPLALKPLFRNHYDVTIDTEQSHFLSVVFSWLIKSDFRMGFSGNGRDRCFDKSVDYRQDIYEAYMFWELIDAGLNIGQNYETDFPYFQNNSGKLVNRLILSEFTKKIICFFPGATVSERLWPEERWAAVVDKVTALGFNPVLLGGQMEVPQCSRIASICKTEKMINVSGKLSLSDTAYLFRHADALISTDSGILHFAAMCNIPTISLFGAGIATKWAPEGDKHYLINKELGCSPCTMFGNTPKCTRGHLCMEAISGSDVLKKFNKFIKGN